MSDCDNSPPPSIDDSSQAYSNKNNWTVEAENELLLQAVKQLLDSSQSTIKPSKILINDRSPSSISQRWSALKAKAVAYDISVIKPGVTRPRKSKKNVGKGELVGDYDNVDVDTRYFENYDADTIGGVRLKGEKGEKSRKGTRGVARPVPSKGTRKGKPIATKKTQNEVEDKFENDEAGNDTKEAPTKKRKFDHGIGSEPKKAETKEDDICSSVDEADTGPKKSTKDTRDDKPKLETEAATDLEDDGNFPDTFARPDGGKGGEIRETGRSSPIL